jgi:hypothetical protein
MIQMLNLIQLSLSNVTSFVFDCPVMVISGKKKFPQDRPLFLQSFILIKRNNGRARVR